jgi:hypothetical protein
MVIVRIALCISLSLPHVPDIQLKEFIGCADQCQRVAVVFLGIGGAEHNVAQRSESTFSADAPGSRMHGRLRIDA